jgi:hypothetical protein
VSSNGTTPGQVDADTASRPDQPATTVTRLHPRRDLRSRAQRELARLKERATTATGSPRADLSAGAAALLAMVVALVIWQRRR